MEPHRLQKKLREVQYACPCFCCNSTDTTDMASQMHTILGTANIYAASHLYDSLIT
jgi:hypothetical protein